MNKEMLHSLVNSTIKVDRGGPESRVGKLLAAAEDHITVLTAEDGVIYYYTHHIKSLTINAKNEVQLDLQVPEDFVFIQAKDYRSVLKGLQYKWVKINRGGPETLEGIMDEVHDDFITIVSNEEVIRISMFHMRNISYGVKIEKSKDDENANKNDEKAKKQEGNKK
ncbi:hypothetical protein MHB48_02670 [Psychrobacillus sp. FSL H8-0483]|uniref:hypothetical protein n=1 Tax=Psychrobacillus sp. FSL H8-0483 TaxID=2921389 RepID=UPI003159A8B3